MRIADTGAPVPTPRASLADMMRGVANAGMNSVANVNMYLKIVGVPSLSQLCLSEQKEVVSVRLLQFGFTATTGRRRTWLTRGRGHGDGPSADNARPAALTDYQLERQLAPPADDSTQYSCPPPRRPTVPRPARFTGVVPTLS
jgi:hypothetical protein